MSDVSLQVQQTPNPCAQFPAAVPLFVVHSELKENIVKLSFLNFYWKNIIYYTFSDLETSVI
jgi:hypothetical protein